MSIGRNGGVVNDLLLKTNAGIHLYTQEEIENYIITVYTEFKNYGSIRYHGIDNIVKQFNQDEMASKFSYLFNNVLNNQW